MIIYKLNEDGTAEIIGAPDLGRANLPPQQTLAPPARPVNMKAAPPLPGNHMRSPKGPKGSSAPRLPAPPRRGDPYYYGYNNYPIATHYVPTYAYNYYDGYPAYYTIGFPYSAYAQRYRDMTTLYPSKFYGANSIINREYAYGEFDFTDGSPGLFARQGNFSMSAGSADEITDIVKVNLGNVKYVKTCTNPKQARLIFADLLNSLYYNRSQLTSLLVNYGFEDIYKIKADQLV